MLQLLLALLMAQVALATQWFPLTRKGEIPTELEPFQIGQEVPLDCIIRNIDNGEHKFDDQGNIIYGPFPKCQETGKPLTFRYGVNEDINCTIGFTDELYHLFQLYVHEDAPFSCRVPLSSELGYIEKGGAAIPLTFNLRGEVHESHFDVDSLVNVLFTIPGEASTIVSAVAWSSGTNTTRMTIGEYLTLSFAVRWNDHMKNTNSLAQPYHYAGLPYGDGFYKLPANLIPLSYSMFVFYLAIVSLATGALILAFAYNVLSIKFSKRGYRAVDGESLVTKRD